MLDALESAILAQAVETAEIRTDPDGPCAVLGNREQVVAAQAVRVLGIVPVTPKTAIGKLLVEPGRLATAPDAPLAIDQQGRNIIAGQRGGVVRIMPPDPEVHAVIARQSIPRANPDESIAALAQGVDLAGWQAIGNPQQLEPRFRRWWTCIHERRQQADRDEDSDSSHDPSPPRYRAMLTRDLHGRPAIRLHARATLIW